MSLTCEASWPCLEYRRLARPPYSKLRFQSALLSRRNRQIEANRLSLSLSDSVLDSRSEMSNSAASREASIQASTLCVFWEVTQDDKRARALSCQKGTKGWFNCRSRGQTAYICLEGPPGTNLIQGVHGGLVGSCDTNLRKCLKFVAAAVAQRVFLLVVAVAVAAGNKPLISGF